MSEVEVHDGGRPVSGDGLWLHVTADSVEGWNVEASERGHGVRVWGVTRAGAIRLARRRLRKHLRYCCPNEGEQR